jgi:hypothetical protein
MSASAFLRLLELEHWFDLFERHDTSGQACHACGLRHYDDHVDGLGSFTTGIRTDDLMHLFIAYAENAASAYAPDDPEHPDRDTQLVNNLPDDVRERMERVLAIIYRDRITEEFETIRQRLRGRTA